MGKTYFYVTDDIENGNWHVSTTDKCYDPGLLFDDNGKEWKTIGDTLQMYYDWPDFCGYRFALFHYATKEVGGVADFDWFHVK